MSETPELAEQFIFGKRYSFLKRKEGALVVGYVEGIDRGSPTGNLALAKVRVDGVGWLSLSEWEIEGENK